MISSKKKKKDLQSSIFVKDHRCCQFVLTCFSFLFLSHSNTSRRSLEFPFYLPHTVPMTFVSHSASFLTPSSPTPITSPCFSLTLRHVHDSTCPRRKRLCSLLLPPLLVRKNRSCKKIKGQSARRVFRTFRQLCRVVEGHNKTVTDPFYANDS